MTDRASQIPVYVGQAVFAGVMLLLEIYLYSLLAFTHDSHTATFAVSITLSGLALGAFVGFWLRPQSFGSTARLSAPVVAVLVLVHLLGCAVLADSLLWTILWMIPVFAAIAYVVSAGYRFAPAGKVFFFELQGACVGSIIVYFWLDRFGIEATAVLASAVAFAGGLAGFVGRLDSGGRRALLAVYLVVAIALGAAAVSLAWDPIPFLSEAVIRGRYPTEGDFLLSRASFEGRVDTFERDGNISFYANGHLQDHISHAPEEVWDFDPRVPASLVASPRVFIIGTSAQGILLSAKRIPGATIDSVEINSAIVDLMRSEFYEPSGRSYDGIGVTVAEGRAHLLRSPARWDLITLMNPYPYTSPYSPDYLHTVEAFQLYLDRLTERGSVILEEWVTDADGAVQGLKTIATIREALAQRGVRDAHARVLVYFWGWGRHMPYLQVIFRERAYSPEELSRLDRFFERMGEVTDYRIEWVHRPDADLDNRLSEFLRTGELHPDYQSEGYRVEPTTDDLPFPKQIRSEDAELRRMLVVGCALFAVLAVVAALIHRRRRRRARMSLLLSRYGFFVGTGFGLLIFEFYFIHSFQLFVGLPSLAFILALTGLLFGGSIGGTLAARFELYPRLWLIATAVIAVVVSEDLGREGLFELASRWDVVWRGAVVFGLAAVPGMAHGTLFPSVIAHIKRESEDESTVALYYGVSSLAAVFASIFSIYVSVRVGFHTTLLLTVAAYGVVLICLGGMRAASRA